VTALRRSVRHARRFLVYGAFVVLVLVAVLVGVANQLLPLAERHPERIAAWLSERAGRTVAFERVETEWTRRGPLLRLDDLRVGDGAQAIRIGDTEMLVSMYAGLLPGRSFSELRLRGLDLTVERADDGQWSVRGLPGQQQPGGDPLAALERLGEFQVIGGRLHVVAPSLGIDATVPKIDVRLQVHGDRVRSGVRAWMRPGVSPLDAALDFDRRRGDGTAYAGARQADFAVWSPLLKVIGVQAQAGTGRAAAWAQLRDHRVAALTIDAKLAGVRLRGAPLREASGTTRVPQAGFSEVEARARWRVGSDGWRFDAPQLRLNGAGGQQRLDGLVLAGGQRYGLLARRVDAAPLFALAALSDRLAPGMRAWLLSARPRALLEDIEVAGRRGGAMHAEGRIVGAGFSPVGNAPGVRGLGGRIDGDADGFVFAPDPAARVDFDWPVGFGVVHPATLRGDIAGWREGAGWRVGVRDLYVRGDDFGVHARGGLWWQGDGTRPRIDLAAELDESPIPAAKGFWVRHLMPDSAERWLDNALLAGRVQHGRAIVSGDLDDWPFHDHDGLFRADAHIEDATLKFQPDWPAAEHVSGDVSFVADGFTVAGKGSIAGVGITAFDAGIPHFGKAELSVRAQGGGDASKLLTLLRQSPLQKEYGETLANIAANGPADVTYDLLLPMHDNLKPRMHGTVALRGATLRERRWNLAFDDVRGSAEYGGDGFAAEQLAVRHDGQPGKLSLRAGGFARDKAQAFEAELAANVSADALLDHADTLAWLKPYLDGRSAWTIAVAIPRTQGRTQPPSKLQLRSNLVGTALSLPAPLRKDADTPLATTVDTDLPMETGEVSVALGNLAALRARSGKSQTGVRVVLGSSRVEEAPPASGLVATGRASALDAIDWIAIAKGGSDDKGGGLPLRRIDVSADRLLLLGGSFADTRVQVVPANAASAVTVSGAALNGTLQVPDADGAAITGRFDRVYWRSATPATNARTTDTAVAGSDDVNPAKIPPLAFDIADLRFNTAQLGSARVRTRPTASGMRLEQLQTRAAKQRIDLAGEWNGQGAATRTNIDLAIDSDDFGALLDGFGYGGQLAGGDGSARFTASWPGAPMAFRLQAMEGQLALDAKDGRLLELEPGAGRVLGLLSIAQLPRRLTLDFRDFFSKGFAFNRMDGHVRVGQGDARSTDLKIDGPAAQIRIRGAADLQAQTFDQTVEVLPKAGNLLTVAGAIAGGPVGAAIGAAANAMLNKPLGQIAAKTYRVTGPWKDPKVEVVRRNQQGRAAADEAVPQG